MTEPMTLARLQAELDRLDKGLLLKGSHTADSGEFCALEFESQVRGRAFSDRPLTLPDIRPLNDSRWWPSDAARTEALLPLMVALWGWADWTPGRRKDWATRVAIKTVQRIVAELPQLPDAIRAQCRNAQDAREAAQQARAAYAAADYADYAAYAADYAAYAAADAADADADAAAAYAYAAAAADYAAYAAADAAYAYAAAAADAAAYAGLAVLRTACAIWIEAAEESGPWSPSSKSRSRRKR